MKGPAAHPSQEGRGLAVSGPEAESQPASVPLEWGALYQAHAQRVACWASQLAGPTLEVEDLVQEVFLIVHQLLPSFRGDAQVTTWLYRITENVVRHRRRRERMRRWLFGGQSEQTAKLPSTRPGPAEDLERRQASELVYRVLDGMPHRYRTVLILFEIDGRSGDEVAGLTGTKLATVWVWLHRARGHFLRRLEKLQGSEQRSAKSAVRGKTKWPSE